MERDFLLRQLVQAEQDVAESTAFIAEQQRVVVESERDGRDCAAAMRLLETFLLLQQSRKDYRARIIDELSQSP